MELSYRIISIGTLSRNRFWNENAQKRSAHATTTLIRDCSTLILVDPGLPDKMLAHYLDERAGITPDQIDVVFMTTYHPVHRRSLFLFEKATWLMYEPEITAMRAHLTEIAERADTESEEMKRLVSDERSILDRIQPADDKLTRQVHLFPCKGVTPGSAALLLALPSRTAIVAGDAVINRDYYQAGQVFEQVLDLADAQESFLEIVEIANEIVPGHDNVFSTSGS